MSDKILCIGGPKDKELITDCGSGFTHVVNPKGDNYVFSGEHHRYAKHHISGGDRPPITFYALEGIDPYAAIVRVFTAYAKPTPFTDAIMKGTKK